MAHECPECSQYCYCDGEDHGQEAPEDCLHCRHEDNDPDWHEPGEGLHYG